AHLVLNLADDDLRAVVRERVMQEVVPDGPAAVVLSDERGVDLKKRCVAAQPDGRRGKEANRSKRGDKCQNWATTTHADGTDRAARLRPDSYGKVALQILRYPGAVYIRISLSFCYLTARKSRGKSIPPAGIGVV